MVFVLDTSGSMQGARIKQARAALKFCLRNLHPEDRFALINFASTVNVHTPKLIWASREHLHKAQQMVDGLEAEGGTDINSALETALQMRTTDTRRTFTIVFFTDGQPTVGETNPDRILENVAAKNTANTRIFTFGVGDDVNAVLLDRLADSTRSVSTYVRESEDIETKVSGLYAKISHPVLTGLKLSVGPDVSISEVYPPHLPDLFHGSQLVVLGRYKGHGPSRVTLTGSTGVESKEFVYEVNFPGHTKDERAFVEDLWARRKVGYLLDQIRTSGNNKELVDEVVRLAKRHGIATPYTSYLVVPDTATPVANNGTYFRRVSPAPDKEVHFLQALDSYPAAAVTGVPTASAPATALPSPGTVQFSPVFVSPTMQWAMPPTPPAPSASTRQTGGTEEEEEEEEEDAPTITAPRGVTVSSAVTPYENHGFAVNSTTGKLGVDLSEQLSALRNQSQLAQCAAREANGRRCVELGGAWIDDGFRAKMKRVTVKAQSAAYFRILERHPEMKEVFRLGNRVVWVTPSQSALVIDTTGGQEQMSDEAIDALFVAKK
jgi:Ca-activated chloride channel family protein